MKQCPVCKTTYTDDSLRFCLTDGASLFPMPEPAETVQMSPGKKPMQINIPQESTPTFAVPKTSNQSSGSKTGLVVAAVLGGLLFLVIAAVAGGYFLLKSSTETANNSVSPNSSKNTSKANSLFEMTNSASPTPDDKTDELKEKIAELEKQIQEQKKQQNQTPPQSSPQNQMLYARVNSPRDGFLALRSEPNAETGERLAKIPHGASIQVLGCQNNTATIAGRRGRWCQVSYGGQYGWAFDAWMIY